MTPEERQILNELLEKTNENHALLKKMRRHMAFGTMFRFLYWVMILGTAVGAFYYLQPYLENLISIYGGVSDTVNGLQGISLQNFL